MGYRKNWDSVEELCRARNGERCKDCILYGKECANYKKVHHNCKPCDNDPYKRAAQYNHFTKPKEDNYHGN